MALKNFEPGQHVFLRALKRKGIVREKLSQNRYRVALGDMLLTCQADDLTLEPELPAATRRNKRHQPQPSGIRVYARKEKAVDRVDLHGLRVVEALARVDEVLNAAVLGNILQVDIVHGIGSGRIKEALHKHLSNLKVVKAFSPDPLNPGVTRVFL